MSVGKAICGWAGAAAIYAGAASTAGAVTVDFEGYPTSPPSVSVVSEDFNGYTFTGAFATDPAEPLLYIWEPAAPNSNGTNSLILGYDTTLTITKTGGGLFDLVSFDVALSFYTTSTTHSILVDGAELSIDTFSQTYALGIMAIPALVIETNGLDGYITMDNFVFSDAGSGVNVPIPAALPLLIGALGVLGVAGRRRA